MFAELSAILMQAKTSLLPKKIPPLHGGISYVNPYLSGKYPAGIGTFPPLYPAAYGGDIEKEVARLRRARPSATLDKGY